MRKKIGNLSRRELLKFFGMSLGATLVGPVGFPLKVQAAGNATPRKNARNVIVIQNCGAMSPVDTLDLKETKFTPKDLDIQKVFGDFYLSKTLFPNYSVWAPKATLVRSMRNDNSLIHFAGQYYTQAGRALNVALSREIPAFGSVIAMELESERRASDTFPTFISFDLWNVHCPQIGSGFLPARFAGLDINTASVFASFGGKGDSSQNKSTLAERWDAMQRMSEVSPRAKAPMGGKADEYAAHYDYGFKLLSDSRFKKVLDVTDEEKFRWTGNDTGLCKIGLALMLARNILAADAGARFIWCSNAFDGTNGPFDNHEEEFGRNPGKHGQTGALSIYESAPKLDRALSNLVHDLSILPGREPGKTLLDETMIAVLHEFGRTPVMNSAGGRDHWNHYTNLFLGAGVKAGRIIGKTDDTYTKILDTGWSYKEHPTMDHVATTIYSALGIDWSKKITNTPSGRAYEYQQTAPLGGSDFIPRDEISPLFV